MTLSETLRLILRADTGAAVKGLENVGKAADRELGRTEDKTLKTAKTLQKFGTGAVLVAGTVAAGLWKAAGATSDLEQAVGGTEAVFKDAARVIDDYADDAADAMGLSERAFRQATTTIGGNLKRMGFDVDEAASKSVELAQTAADLAATYGGTTAEAVDALGAAFRGEADPAERFNLNLKQGAVNAKAVELGLAASTSEVDENAKAQALLALITEQSADAQGQFAREADTAAGAAQRAAAAGENAQASLGEAMAPIMADLADAVAGGAKRFSEFNEATDGAAAKVLTYGTFALGAAGATAAVVGKVIELSRVMKSLNMDMAKGAAAFGAAALAVGLYVDMMNDAKKAGKDQVETLRDQWSALGDGERGIKKIDDVMRVLDRDIANLSSTIEGSQAPWDHDKRAQMKASREEAEKFRAELEKERKAIIDLSKEMGVSVDEAEDMFYSQGTLEGAVDETTGEIDIQAAATNALTEAFEELDDQLNSLFSPLFAAQDASNDLAEAQREAAAAAKEHGARSKEAAEANDKVVQAALRNESAQIKLRAAIESGEVKVNDAIATLNRWVAEGKITQDQANWTALSFSAMRDQANSIPRSVSVNVELTGFQKTVAELDALSAKVGQNRLINASISARDFAAQRKSGGPVPGAKGQPVPILAHGGEMVLSADIVDAIKKGKQTAGLPALASASTSGSGNHYSITVNALDTSDGTRKVIDIIESYERRNGRR